MKTPIIKKLFAFVCLLGCYATGYGQTTELINRFSTDAQSGQFGYATAVDDERAIVGAYSFRTNSATVPGAAFIYEQQADGTWQKQTLLLASDGTSADQFGWSVAIDGDRAIVGAPFFGPSNDRGNGGAAYIYERQSDGTWQEQAALKPSGGDAFDEFGHSVAIDGDLAIVGDYRNEAKGQDAGAAYVYERQSDGTWIEQTQLLASDGRLTDQFGWAVALDGNRVIVGAPSSQRGRPTGAAYIYERQNNGAWQEQAKLLASNGETGDQFGSSVAIDGSRVVIGAPQSKAAMLNVAGAAYVYDRQSNGTWTEQAQLLASDPSTGDRFGNSVALAGDRIMVGAPGDDNQGSNAGAAYLFKKQSDGTWREQTLLVASDGNANNQFGASVALQDQGGGLVGAPFASLLGGGTSSAGGEVYFYEEANEPPVLQNLPAAALTVACDAVPDPPTVTATDDTDPNVEVVFSETRVNRGCLTNYTLTRQWTATDADGSTARFTQTITVEDTEAPELDLSALTDNTLTVTTEPGESTAAVTFPITASDNCAVEATLTYTANGAPVSSGDAFPVGTTDIEVSATDGCGNVTTATFTLNVQGGVIEDVTPPVISLENDGDNQLTADEQCVAERTLSSFVASITDNVDQAIVPVFLLVEEGNENEITSSTYEFPLGTTTLRVRATDNAGNSAEETFTVTVTDETAPVITVRQSSLGATEGSVDLAANVVVEDNCAVATTTFSANGQEITEPSRFAVPTGETTITVRASDEAGNQADEKTFTVSKDAEPITITFPGADPNNNFTLESEDASCQATSNLSDLVAVSGTGTITLAFARVDENGNELEAIPAEDYADYRFPVGTTRVRVTATDGFGNRSEATFVVEVIDTVDPVIDVVQSQVVATGGAVDLTANVTVADNCAIEATVFLANNQEVATPTSYVPPVGETTITVRATDASGNEATATFTVKFEQASEKEVLALNLTSVCSDDPDQQLRWRIRNPNDFEVAVTWQVYGSAQSGTVTAPPGDSFFFTQTEPGPNTTIIRWKDEDGRTKQKVKASGKVSCQPTTAEPSLLVYPTVVEDVLTIEVDGPSEGELLIFDSRLRLQYRRKVQPGTTLQLTPEEAGLQWGRLSYVWLEMPTADGVKVLVRRATKK